MGRVCSVAFVAGGGTVGVGSGSRWCCRPCWAAAPAPRTGWIRCSHMAAWANSRAVSSSLLSVEGQGFIAFVWQHV